MLGRVLQGNLKDGGKDGKDVLLVEGTVLKEKLLYILCR